MSEKIKEIKSLEEFEKLSKNSKSAIFLVFSSNDDKGSQVEGVVEELSFSLRNVDVPCIKIEADSIPQLNTLCHVESFPTVALLEDNKLQGRVEGVAPREIKKLVEEFVKLKSDLKAKKEALNERLKTLVRQQRVMAFIKGTADKPFCGFSKKLVAILNSKNVKFGHFNIFEDEEVRQGLKEFSNWPTYPQLYVDGELLGGLDVITEMQEEGQLDEALGIGA